MQERLGEREESVKERKELESLYGHLPTFVPNEMMDPREPYIENADQDMTRTYIKFTAPAKIAEGITTLGDNWNNYITAGKLWAEWGHQSGSLPARNCPASREPSWPQGQPRARQRGQQWAYARATTRLYVYLGHINRNRLINSLMLPSSMNCVRLFILVACFLRFL